MCDGENRAGHIPWDAKNRIDNNGESKNKKIQVVATSLLQFILFPKLHVFLQVVTKSKFL